jgi:hypothetical protein
MHAWIVASRELRLRVKQRGLGAPFGGATQLSTRREECSEKMLYFTAEKNIRIKLRAQRQ